MSALLLGIIGAMISSKKGSEVEGFFLGFILGPIGIIIAFLLVGNRTKCPYCKEYVAPDSVKCPNCQADLSENSEDEKESFNIEKEQKKCPSCKEKIKLEALKCKHCGAIFNPDDVKKQIEEIESQYKVKIEKIKSSKEYELMKDSSDEAFCIICRRISPMNGMYYSKKSGEYYHEGCLLKKIE